MGRDSGIAWTHNTFNAWWGCDKVSAACNFCYAETFAKRLGMADLWRGKRRTFGDKHWREPERWNREAEASGQRVRVFSASMADVFDANAPVGARERLFDLIRRTPSLDWLLLTKRIEHAAGMLPADWGNGWPNVWLGSTLERQEYDWRMAALAEVPAVVRFLSCEPLLEEITLEGRPGWDAIDWVITGAESGAKARPMDRAWARSLRDQCARSGVAFFHKQEIIDGRKTELPPLDGVVHDAVPR